MATTPQEALATLRARSAAGHQRALDHANTVRALVACVVQRAMPGHGRCWLIGSLCWGNFGERSDIDLVFDGLSDREITAVELAVSAATSLLVDCLSLTELPEAFRDRVTKEGMRIDCR